MRQYLILQTVCHLLHYGNPAMHISHINLSDTGMEELTSQSAGRTDGWKIRRADDINLKDPAVTPDLFSFIAMEIFSTSPARTPLEIVLFANTAQSENVIGQLRAGSSILPDCSVGAAGYRILTYSRHLETFFSTFDHIRELKFT
jgi:hypothetical protein